MVRRDGGGHSTQVAPDTELMAKKRSSSKAWLKEHREDPYVQQAQREGYRSRACYKLLELQERDKLIRPGMTVLDLGSAPGGWSQVAVALVGHSGRVIASDILPMDTIAGVEFIQGDFTEEEVFEQLLAALAGTPVDLVISDMAPNMSGLNAVDQPRSIYLVELALDMARQVLTPGGKITCLYESHPGPASGQRSRRYRAIDAATDDEHVVLLLTQFLHIAVTQRLPHINRSPGARAALYRLQKRSHSAMKLAALTLRCLPAR